MQLRTTFDGMLLPRTKAVLTRTRCRPDRSPERNPKSRPRLGMGRDYRPEIPHLEATDGHPFC